MVTVSFKGKKAVEAPSGSTLLEVALENGIPLYHTCGGNCSCSTCRVVVLKGAENLSPPEDPETQVLDSFELKPPHRLGCQALVLKGEVVVSIPERAKPCRANKTPPVTKGRHATY
ncbi:MAG: (2Fe-2S)-binding protein [Candidatus Omnitrophica bacterium]|nr:(2Fe-2S)-binding protein [Candidatus Omnitrophota bacterium]